MFKISRQFIQFFIFVTSLLLAKNVYSSETCCIDEELPWNGIDDPLQIDWENGNEYQFYGYYGGAASIEIAPEGNNSLRYVKDTGESWAGVEILLGSTINPAMGKIFTAEIHSTVAREINFKIGSYAELNTSHTGSGWEELEFDFRDIDIDTNQTSIQFINALGVVGEGGDDWTIYIDNIVQSHRSKVTFLLTAPVGATTVQLHSGAFGWDPNHPDGVASDNGDGTWSLTLDPAWESDFNYKWVVDGVEENLRDDIDAGYCANDDLNVWGGPHDWGGGVNRLLRGGTTSVTEVAGDCSDTPAAGGDSGDSGSTAVTFTVTAPAGADTVYLWSDLFGWDSSHPAGVASDNGDGTWSLTLDLAWESDFNYKWVVDGVEENLRDDYVAGFCTNDDLLDWGGNGELEGVNRWFRAGTTSVTDVASNCSDTPVTGGNIVGSDPIIPASPTPTDPIDSVLSVFSTTYGNLAGTNFNPNWGQSTQVTVGDMLTLENFNYQGIELPSEIDVSGYEYLNVSYYLIESIPVNFTLVSPSREKPYALNVSTLGVWNNVQIPLSHYDNVNLADVIQLKVDSTDYCWNNNCLIAFSNIYFGGVNPEKYLADFEEEADAYEIAGFDGGLASIEEAPDGTNSLKYVKGAGANWAGVWINLENAVDVAKGEIITADVYSTVAREITLKFDHANVERVVSHGGTGWESLSYDFTDAMPGDQTKIVFLNDLSQPGDGTDAWTIYIDNLAQTNTSETVFVTFQVDMTAVDTNADGVYIAAGNFGQDGFLLTNDGSDVWRATVSVNKNTQVIYKFRNQPSYGTWQGFEDSWGLIDGGCVTGGYNDRFVDIAEANIVLDIVAFGSCTAAAPVQAFYNVTFSVDMNGVDLGGQIPTINGTFNTWCGECNPLTDDDGDGVWTTTLLLPAGNIEYKFTLGSWVGQETVGADCVNAAQNRSLTIADADVAAEVTPYGGCPSNPDLLPLPEPEPVASDDYCAAPITHFMIEAEITSSAFLTVERVDANNVDVSISSADADPIDLLIIGAQEDPASAVGAMTLDNGTATIRLNYDAGAPDSTKFEVLWSKDSTGGNWMIRPEDLSAPINTSNVCAGGTPPPPEPNPEGEVLSIFSDTLGNMSGANFYPQWGQATQVTVSDVLTYSNLDYQGIEIPDTDVSNYEYLHIDFYTNDLSALSVRLSSHPEATTNAISLTDQIVTGQWVSVEIPIVNIMTGFHSANKSVNQLIFEGNGTVLLGNIYFGEVAFPKGYCAAPVTHSNIEAETASAVLLTVDRVDANSIDVSVTSADTDPVDFLMIEIPYAQNAQISDMTLDDGTATVTLTWFDVAPDSVSLDVFWSKESTDANWMLHRTDLSYIDTSYGCDEFVFFGYGGASIVGSEYITLTDAESWAGFSNGNTGLYPITFNEHSAVTFTASVPSGEDALVRFRFEAGPYPDISPYFSTLVARISGAEPATYSLCVPSQGDNLFNSVQMYLITRDVGVVIDNVSIESDASCTSADPITPEFLAGAPTPTINQDEVVSLFSDQYSSSLSGVYPDYLGIYYGFESEITIDNENTIKKIDDFIFALYPLPFETSIEDKTMLSVSLYSQRSFDLEIRLSASEGGGDIFYNLQSLDMPVDQWFTVDIDLSEYSGSLPNIVGLGFATNDYTQTIYVDDIYFHGQREPVLTLTVTAPDATSVGFTGEWWNWETDNPAAPKVIDNGNGTWTAIFDHNSWFSPDAIMKYAWVIDGVVENLENGFGSEECYLRLVDGTLTHDGVWRTWISGSGDVIGDVAGSCDRDSDSDGVANKHDFAPEDPSIWATQILSLSVNSIGNLGELFQVEVEYDVSNNNNQLSGTGFRLHYNSEVVSIESFENLLSKDMVVEPTGPFVDLENYDNDEFTDEYYLFGWASLLGDWPSENLPAKLMTVQLNLLNNHQFNTTSINISKSSSPIGYEFESEPFNLELEEKHTWDFDQDGQVDALTDGLILMRHGFSLFGENLIRDATNNPNITHQDVTNALEDAQGIIDIDGNGHFDALTDGLILMRYLYSLKGENLINDAISIGANRASATEITSYIQLHMP